MDTREPLPISDPESLLGIEMSTPEAKGHDVLVEVRAISVNPVDVKIRASGKPEGSEYEILGWDAAGVVQSVGAAVTLIIGHPSNFNPSP